MSRRARALMGAALVRACDTSAGRKQTAAPDVGRMPCPYT